MTVHEPVEAAGRPGRAQAQCSDTVDALIGSIDAGALLHPDPDPVRAHARLPGGALVEKIWWSSRDLTVVLRGELDDFDRYALHDLLSGCLLTGASQVEIDAASLSFADLAVFRILDHVRRSLRRTGGCLEVTGLSPPLTLAWEALRPGNRPSGSLHPITPHIEPSSPRTNSLGKEPS